MIAVELSIVESLGRLHARPWATEVTGVQIDSRRVEEGDLFVAVGAGADFVRHALALGAAAALVPDDAHVALATIAGAVRARSSARVVGITGSTGKTTTKDILASICSPHRRTVANEANYNQELGVPLTICRVEEDTEICISEMGMRGLGQIAYLAGIAQPHVGVITNVGPVHLELVESIENVARAKAELLDALPPGGVAVVPAHEPLLEPYLAREDLEVVRVPDVEDVDPFPVAANFTARHQLQNTLTALAVADVLGIPRPDRVDVVFSPLREEERELSGGVLLINDCYNANPMSMRAALRNLAARAGDRRRVAVLGDMAELGPTADAYHREVGELVRQLGVETIAVGPLARAYGGTWVADAAAAAAALRDTIRPGDVVLVKGSRSVGLEAVAENLTP
jgi:UDP-N-acetylmuramoyl-tripeptide--D-alanyl-D-alanine ligase